MKLFKQQLAFKKKDKKYSLIRKSLSTPRYNECLTLKYGLGSSTVAIKFKAMNQHNEMRFDYSLYRSDQAIRGIDHFVHDAEHEMTITVPVDRDVYVLAINLASSSDTYFIGSCQHVIPGGHFNIFSISKDTARWVFKEGFNSVILISCTPQFMTMLGDNYGWIKGHLLLNSGQAGSLLNQDAYVITPAMEIDLDRILSDTDGDGPLHSMYMEAKGMSLLFSAIQTSDDHRNGKIDNATVLEVKRVYEHMVTCLEDVIDGSQLAKIAQMPEARFHRVFDLLYLMSIDTALERERLNLAESLVCYSQDDIFDISVKAGFPSFQLFLDAFESRFGMHPAHFREVYGHPSALE